jgi:hypothetical protein
MAAEPVRERPAPLDKPETIALGPGQPDQSFMLQAILQVQRELGSVSAKLDRVIADTSEHRRQLDEMQHTLSFVRGGFYVLLGAAIVALLGWLLRHVGVTIAM